MRKRLNVDCVDDVDTPVLSKALYVLPFLTTAIQFGVEDAWNEQVLVGAAYAAVVVSEPAATSPSPNT